MALAGAADLDNQIYSLSSVLEAGGIMEWQEPSRHNVVVESAHSASTPPDRAHDVRNGWEDIAEAGASGVMRGKHAQYAPTAKIRPQNQQNY